MMKRDRSFAYRGWAVKDCGAHGLSITAGGAHVGWAKDEADARRIIDDELGDA